MKKIVILLLLVPILTFGKEMIRDKRVKPKKLKSIHHNKKFIGSDIIGWSYNIFDRYANNESKKKPLFEFRKNSDMVILENISKHDIRTISGSNSHQYTKSVSARLGMSYESTFGLFKASMESSFGKKNMGSMNTSFVTIQDYIWKYRISLDIRNKKRDLGKLRDMLEATAKEDINTMDPKRLFDIYGTHFITRAYIGGRADYHATIKNSSKFSQEDIAVNVKLEFKKINSDIGVSRSKTNREISKNRKTKLTITGGNSEFINNIHNNKQYAKWVSGIKTSPVLCDFDKGSLTPIWVLATSKARRDQLEKYFKESYILQYPLPKLVKHTNDRPTWEPRDGECFFIKNKKTGKYFDLPGRGYDSQNGRGQVVYLWGKDNYGDRYFCVKKSKNGDGYNLKPFSSYNYVEVSGSWDKKALSNKWQRGININLWNFHDKESQRFTFEVVDKSTAGYVAVYIKANVSGLYLEAEKNGDGAKIIQNNFKGDSKQIWHFEAAPNSVKDVFHNDLIGHTFYLKNVKTGNVMDPPGKGHVGRKKKKLFKKGRSGNCHNGTNVGQYKIDGGNDQHVKFVHAGGKYYYIEFQHCKAKYRLDVSGNWKRSAGDSKYKTGRNLQLWDHTNNDAQKFYLENVGNSKYYIINKATRKGVAGNHNNTYQGDKIRGKKGKREQLWYIIDIHNKKRLKEFGSVR